MRIYSFNAIYRDDVKPARFLATLILSGIAFGLYKGIQDNYMVEILHITPFERGLVEFFRELPGLLVVLILAWMYRLSESRVFKIGIAIMLSGLLGLLLGNPDGGSLGGKCITVLFMVVFSFGEHIIMPVRTTLSLDIARPNTGGAALGITSTISNLGNIAGYLLVSLVFFVFSRFGFVRTDTVQFKAVFALSAALMLCATLVSLALYESKIKVQRRRFYFAKKFSTFYMLEVFYGARKQIFITFAPLVLIREYGADTSVIALLLGICAIFGTLLSPFMGKLIDKVGYKIVMVTDTLVLVIVCMLYGFAHRLFPRDTAFIIVCINYVLDSIISLASMATNVYVRSIADSPEEITATLSTGISVNHIISIFIALTGGWIWQITGIEVLFSLSAFLGLLNSLYAARIQQPHKNAQSLSG
ncbi:MAG: MFS transporter [Spirochaetaceae bacterium]|jgi:MFS family permease|nr:MFS transporter [Spirochaetaceae bacterium]